MSLSISKRVVLQADDPHLVEWERFDSRFDSDEYTCKRRATMMARRRRLIMRLFEGTYYPAVMVSYAIGGGLAEVYGGYEV